MSGIRLERKGEGGAFPFSLPDPHSSPSPLPPPPSPLFQFSPLTESLEQAGEELVLQRDRFDDEPPFVVG